MHQFDNFEKSSAEPWAAPSYNTGRDFSGRISCFLAWRGMSDQRRDRVAIPLISRGGGVVVDPSIKHRCSYGDDGSTWRAKGGNGCYSNWCDPSNVWRGGASRRPCGFGDSGQINHAWHSYDLQSMLQLYVKHGAPYKPPQFYSGYNELIYDAWEWNSHLPATVEAFFVVDSKYFSASGASVQRHRHFLSKYHKTADKVPLLFLDPSNWFAPFSASRRKK